MWLKRISSPCSASPADDGEQLGLGVGVVGDGDSLTEQPARAQHRLLRLDHLPCPRDDLGVERVVVADAARQVPRVDEVVADELAQVLLARDVPEREVDGPLQHAGRLERGERAGHRVVPRALRIVTELVALVAVADLLDGLALREMRRPPVLVHEMVHEHAHVPVRARRRTAPLVVANGGHAPSELVSAPLLVLEEIRHARRLRPVPARGKEQGSGYRTARMGGTIAFSADRSSAVGSQSPAAALARTCSGRVAPAITEPTAGSAPRPAIATSSNVRPRSAANRSSASTASNERSEIAAPRAASLVPSGGGSPRRYLPVSNPFASGKYGRMPTPKCAHAGISSRSSVRSSSEYEFCALTKRVAPSRRATASASATCHPAKFDEPT